MQGVQLSYVDDLTPARDFWNMKCRIIRLWEQSYRWDMILVDERGRKIQACVKTHLLPGFRDHLKEDAVVLIKKFGVGAQTDKHKVIPLPHKVNFFKCTEVKPVAGFQGHPYAFEFVPFTTILQHGVGDALTVDVIGRVAWCGDLDIFKSGQKESKRMNFDLQDLGGNVLKCTMWGHYAEQFNNFIASYTSTEMVMVVLQHAKLKIFNGMKTVQNDMYGTRLFINEDLDDANELRRRLILRDGPSSQTVLSSQTCYPLRTEFVVETPKVHVDEIGDIDQEKNLVVVARIMMLEEDVGWFYKACRKCVRKVYTKTEFLEQSKEIPSHFLEAPIDSLWCLKCKDIPTSLVPKFKVQFRVQDSTGSVSFVMFDKDVNKILGLSAVDIRDRQVKSGEIEEYPHELNALTNRQFAFKIMISKYNLEKKYNVYTIGKVCDDPDLIAELQRVDEVDEVNQEEGDPVAIKLDESSQAGVDSKDAVSVTGESLGVEKDSATSPAAKRPSASVVDEMKDCEASTSRSVKKKLDA